MAERAREPRLDRWLLALGAALIALAVAESKSQFAYANDWSAALMLVAAVPFAAAVWLVLKMPARTRTLGIVLGVAAVLRLIALCSPPSLSSDLNRYIWDGRVQAAGLNPYRYTPADPALKRLRDDDIYPHINRKEYAHTIYPPFAQAVFFLTTRISETNFWMKATMLLFEIGGLFALGKLLVLAGLAPQRLLLYAWHPVPIWELAGAGHVDAIMVAGISCALLAAWQGKRVFTALALAAAFLVKFFPLVLLPIFLRRSGRELFRKDLVLIATFVGAVLLAYLPYYLTAGAGAAPVERVKTVLGFLGTYTHEEGLQSGSGIFWLSFFPGALPWLPKLYAAVAAIALFALGLYAWLKPPRDSFSIFRRGLALVAAVIVLGTPHYPWYGCWAIPFLCFIPSRAMFWISLAMPALYFTWSHLEPPMIFWMNAAIYFPAAALALADFRKPILA